jgi:hypothetical protein
MSDLGFSCDVMRLNQEMKAWSYSVEAYFATTFMGLETSAAFQT